MEQEPLEAPHPLFPPPGGDRPAIIQTIHLRVPRIAAVCTGMPVSLPPRLHLQKYLLPHKGEHDRGENQASEKGKYLNTFRGDL